MSKDTFLIGLTGSMGMGKSTTAQMFRDADVPVWDADAAVHQIYGQGGAAVQPLEQIRPQAVIDGAIDRNQLKQWIAEDSEALRQIEAVVHPLIARDRETFLAGLETDIAVLDIPLLLEGGLDRLVDLVLVVSVPPEVQRARILARNTMDLPMLETILAKQMPDSEKRARADRVIETLDIEATRKAVHDLLEEIRNNARDRARHRDYRA